tara:strand:- start:937 stop:1695 length:759 start_codon:yes stop_codon:yes gene_type:complete
MLNNIVVAISGGAGRIGSSFSRAIVENGGKVIIGDVNNDLGNKLISEVGKDNAIFFEGNLIDPVTIDKMIQQGKTKFGKIDAAIHCAYPVSEQWGAPFEKLKPKDLRNDLFNQLGGAILFSQSMINEFINQKHGNLIHISSIQGFSTPKFEHYEDTKMVSPIEYSAIKAGVISITKYLAKYYKGKNIRVNSISPGGILDDQPNVFLKKYNQTCNIKGMLDSNDLCGSLVFLLSDKSKFINGQNIVVDDGWSL